MLVRYHVIAGILVSAVLWPLYGLNALIILASSILIDIDHAFFYIYKFRTLDLSSAPEYFIKKKKPTLLIFHTVEFTLGILVLSLFFRPAFFALIGMSVHLLLDLYEEINGENIGRFPSVFWHILRKH